LDKILNLKEKAISGVKWTALSSMIIAITQLVQLMVFARYLTSYDFGLIAILMLVVNFSLLFVDFGISKAIIYKHDISNTQLSTLYWLNLILGIFIFMILMAISSYIADFYNESSLETLIILISISLVVQSVGQQFRTLFQKRLEFNTLAKIDIFATMLSSIVALVLVTNDIGIYAFVISILVASIVKSTLLIKYGLALHTPTFSFNLYEVKELLHFGLYTVGNGIVGTLSSQIDILIIGKLLGTEILGIYSIAKELILRPMQLINPIITKVAFPTMSNVNSDKYKVSSIYLKIRNIIASINFPIYTFTFIFASEVILLFLGEKWLHITSIFQILAIWAAFRSIESPIGSLVMAMGKPQYEMYWNMGMMIYMPIMVYISSRWGLSGLVYGNLVSIFILLIPSWYFLTYRLVQITLLKYFKSIYYPLLISLFSGSILYSIVHFYTFNIIYKVVLFLCILIIFLFLNKKFNKNFYNTVYTVIGKKR
jgi:O-antigen/teichoic acid export membrane protein